jgi:transcriptional regulator with XRE-family HTH domain
VAADESSGPALDNVADAAREARDMGKAQLEKLGTFIRDQRKQAEMSLRDLASRTNVSNPYLSQIERGLHEPSVRVLRSIAKALNISAETLLVQAGLIDSAGPDAPPPTVATAIMADDRLSDEQKRALLAVYRSYIASDG